MKNYNYTSLIKWALLGCSTYKTFVLLLSLFDLFSAIAFTGMFIWYYTTNNREVGFGSILIIIAYIFSRLISFVITLYPAYLQYGITYQFWIYTVCVILLEIIHEIKSRETVQKEQEQAKKRQKQEKQVQKNKQT